MALPQPSHISDTQPNPNARVSLALSSTGIVNKQSLGLAEPPHQKKNG